MVAVASFITYRYRQEAGRRKLAIDMYCVPLPTSNRLESTVVRAFFLRLLVVVSVAMLAMTWL